MKKLASLLADLRLTDFCPSMTIALFSSSLSRQQSYANIFCYVGKMSIRVSKVIHRQLMTSPFVNDVITSKFLVVCAFLVYSERYFSRIW